MPKLSNIHFRRRAPLSGEEFLMSAPASVSARSGVFSIEITKALFDVMQAAGDGAYPQATLSESKNRAGELIYKISGEQLEQLKLHVYAGIDLLLTAETREELVIFYGYETTCYFWDNQDGTIAPCGRSQDAIKTGKWSEIAKLRWHNSDNPYSLGISAMVRVKVICTSAKGETVKYYSLSHSELKENWADRGKYAIAHRLNEFVHMGKPDAGSLEMPYSDEAAIFFTDMLMSLCAASKRVHEFFSDKTSVQAAIEAKAGLRLPFLPIDTRGQP